ncbi:hypothetical protein [Peribacillus deserti]|uniref:Uncharacterized protein n=1 Tax=Peribacillus deserti TaxID=673318 RepID=A0A2N5M2F3_9BACI|nr:hypothetical protein [Peribacillus deserti]PLT28495.1 hypothetical protein CUU66_18245 [Peribacillus deserti]
MTYITPVTDYQISQYAARTTGEIESAKSYISGAKPVFSVELRRKQGEDIQNEKNYPDYADYEEPIILNGSKLKRNKQVPMHILQAAVEITGKGKFVNKYI